MNTRESKITFQIIEEEKKLIVSIEGAMHFGQRHLFLKNMQNINSEITSCIIDLSKTTHIDSTSIGMLLILKENMFVKNANLTIKTHKNTTIHKLLHSHNLDHIFKIA